MPKRIMVIAVALVLCLACAQSVFADDAVYSDEFRTLEVKESYSLEDAFWFYPSMYAVDVLQFTQAYLMPADPVEFYLAAAAFTDDEIEEQFIIFQSFVEPTYAGLLSFKLSCDLMELEKSVGYTLYDPSQTWGLEPYFETLDDINAIYTRGIGRTDSYNTYRRAALQLAFYAAKYGQTPGFQFCYDAIESFIAYYEQQYDLAMEEEAAAQAAAEAAQQATTEEGVTEGAEITID